MHLYLRVAKKKKKHSIAFLTAEAEYVDIGSCCTQILWIHQQLADYGIQPKCMPIKYNNTVLSIYPRI